jgi:hypothetical protein
MLVNKEPSTMANKKARLRKNDDTRNVMHCRFLNKDGGPYKGSCGNKGLVCDAGICLLSVPPPDFCKDPPLPALGSWTILCRELVLLPGLTLDIV